MGSHERKVKAELNKNILEGFRDFMTRVTKLEELGDTGSRLLNVFQQVLECFRRPPISRTPDLIERIVKANATERFKTYIEAACINSYDSRQCVSKSKSMINELEHLLEGLDDAAQTANGCLSPLRDEKFGDCVSKSKHWPGCHKISYNVLNPEEMSYDLDGVDMIDNASLMGIIYSMVKQDYVMKERIVTSLNLKLSSNELGSYCLMWSLHPFIYDETMQHAWRLVRLATVTYSLQY